MNTDQTEQSQGTSPRKHVISLVFLTLLNDRLARSFVIPILPYIVARYNVSGFTIGLLISSYTITSILAGPISGHLSDRIGRRPVLVSSLGLGAIGMSIFGLASNVTTLFCGRLIDGTGGGGASTAAAVIADVTPPKDQTKAFGLIALASAFSIIIGPGLGGVLAGVSPQLPILFASVLLIANFGLALLFFKETHPHSNSKGIAEKSLDIKGFVQSFIAGFKPLSKRKIGFNSLSYCLLNLGCFGGLSIGSLYLARVLKFDAHMTGLAFTLAGVLTVSQQIFLVPRLTQRLSTLQILMLGNLLGVIGAAVLITPTNSQHFLITTLGLSLFSMSLGLAAPSIRAIFNTEIDTSSSGNSMGIVGSLQNIGSAIGPPLLGYLFDAVNPETAFTCVFIVIIICMGFTGYTMRLKTG